ncbi:enoyl-CoA hydratase [Gordonia sp. HY002]|uniref:enoyl-CoA hydratase n=1 Tax=Gordonia zhenghanii TaxID=2911516 RepID=UPI001EEFA8D8|nr:enoyl-CoA hydratase [Gordonia zhenghanii]MCF8568779.1 enoyl-CoA hydratase [Gordonia zhenghanii]MCF8606112.1 enoyl-CoA hydratase [Gordonia zhenghanii]
MSLIDYRIEDAVALISLNRPEKHNAQNESMLEELDAAWRAAATDDAVKVIVVRANGDNFSAGHDLKSVTSGYEPSADKSQLEKAYGWETEFYLGFSRRWRDVPKPSIASVKGACIAGALNVIWPCDLIVAADNTFFSDPVAKFGVGGVEYHAHTWELGARRAKEMIFTARSFSADEAFTAGMVNRVVPLDELESQTMDLAREIAQMDAWALRQGKRAVNQTLDIMGQQTALQSAFDMHWLGHANSMLTTGYPLLSEAPLPVEARQDRS